MAATVKFYNTDIRPNTDLLLDLGTDALRFNNLYLGGITQLNDINYTWPATQTSNRFLQTNGTGTLSWADPAPSFVTINKWSTDS